MIPGNYSKQAPVNIDLLTGKLEGTNVVLQKRTIADLKNVFADEQARKQMPQDQTVYEVQLFMPVSEGTPGGLYFGNTTIFPGKVGNEYHMTKGHFHAMGDRNEYYLGVSGTGFLLFMDKERKAWVEPMKKGSLHYIGPNVAHRVVNTGNTPLTYLASWPADSGHDYETIREDGFSIRIIEKNSEPVIIEV